MALPYIQTSTGQVARSRVLCHVPVKHRALYGATLAQLPVAVDAMRRARAAQPPASRAVFILDWDDTCCATSFLERSGCMADLDSRIDQFAPDKARLLRVLETRVLSLLKTAVRLGTVLIVTNAGDGWVELSSSRFLPAVRAFLEANYKQVKIISARARYVDAYREHPLQWKALTFADELRGLYPYFCPSRQPLHVIVLGDSVGDQYAAHVAANSLAAAGMNIILKVVKFLERPTIDQLCKELAVLLDHIVAMTSHRGPFDVSMYKEPAPASQQLSTQQIPAHYQRQRTTLPVKAVADQRNSSVLQSSSATVKAAVDPQHAPISPVSAMAACSAVV